MSRAGELTFGINYDISQGLNQLNTLKNALQQLQNISAKDISIGANTANISKTLKTVKEQATQVQTALTNAFNPKLGNVNIAKFKENLNGLNINEFAKNLGAIGPAGAVAFDQLNKSLSLSNLKLKETSDFGRRLAETFGNSARYLITTRIINSAVGSIQKAYYYVKDLDTSLNDIRIVTSKSADEMERFAQKANKAAIELGKSTTDYTKASLLYYQQGLSDREVQARTATTLKASNVTGQSTSEVSEQLTAVWNGFQVEAARTEAVVDKLSAVAASTASNLEELSTGMSKVASAANAMGVDVDQLTAQLSTIISVTRQAPESIGAALKTTYARMSTIQSGGIDEEDGATLTSYSEKMANFGVNVLDANGKLRDMGKVIEEIGGKWTTFSREAQVGLAQAMGGTRQYSNLIALFDNWDKYEAALKTSQNATGTLEKQQAIYMESIEAHMKQLGAVSETLYNNIFDSEAIKKFIDSLTTVVKLVDTLVQSMGGFGNVMTIAANIFMTKLAPQISQLLAQPLINRANKKFNEAIIQNNDQSIQTQISMEKSNFEGTKEFLSNSYGSNELERNNAKAILDKVSAGKALTVEEENTNKLLLQEYEREKKIHEVKLQNLHLSEQLNKNQNNYTDKQKQELENTIKENKLKISMIAERSTSTASDMNLARSLVKDLNFNTFGNKGDSGVDDLQKAISDFIRQLTLFTAKTVSPVQSYDYLNPQNYNSDKFLLPSLDEYETNEISPLRINMPGSELDQKFQEFSQHFDKYKDILSNEMIEKINRNLDRLKENIEADKGLSTSSKDNYNDLQFKINTLNEAIRQSIEEGSGLAQYSSVETANMIDKILKEDNLQKILSEEDIKILQEHKQRLEEISNELKNADTDDSYDVEDLKYEASDIQQTVHDIYNRAVNNGRERVSNLINGAQNIRNNNEQTDLDMANSDAMIQAQQRTLNIQKFTQSVTSISTILTSLPGTISLIQNGFDALSDSSLSFGDRLLKLSTSIGGLVPLIMNIGKALKSVWMSNPWLLLIGGIILGLVEGFNLMSSSLNKAQKEYEEVQKETELLKAANEELNRSYEELTSTVNKYFDATKAIEEAIKGTKEYEEAIKAANEAAQDLINSDMELAKYAYRDADGILRFKQDGKDFDFESYQKNKQRDVVNSNMRVLAAENNQATAKLYADLEKARDLSWYQWNPLNYSAFQSDNAKSILFKKETFDALKNYEDPNTHKKYESFNKEELKKIAESVISKSNNSYEIKMWNDLARELDDSVNGGELITTLNNLLQSNRDLEETNRFRNQQLAQQYNEFDNKDYQNRSIVQQNLINSLEKNFESTDEYKNELQKQTEAYSKNSEDFLKEEYARLNELDANDESLEDISSEQMINTLAAEAARTAFLDAENEYYKNIASQTDLLQSRLNKIESESGVEGIADQIMQIIASDGNFDFNGLAKNQVEALQEALKGKDILKGVDLEKFGGRTSEAIVEGLNRALDNYDFYTPAITEYSNLANKKQTLTKAYDEVYSSGNLSDDTIQNLLSGLEKYFSTDIIKAWESELKSGNLDQVNGTLLLIYNFLEEEMPRAEEVTKKAFDQSKQKELEDLKNNGPENYTELMSTGFAHIQTSIYADAIKEELSKAFELNSNLLPKVFEDILRSENIRNAYTKAGLDEKELSNTIDTLSKLYTQNWQIKDMSIDDIMSIINSNVKESGYNEFKSTRTTTLSDKNRNEAELKAIDKIDQAKTVDEYDAIIKQIEEQNKHAKENSNYQNSIEKIGEDILKVAKEQRDKLANLNKTDQIVEDPYNKAMDNANPLLARMSMDNKAFALVGEGFIVAKENVEAYIQAMQDAEGFVADFNEDGSLQISAEDITAFVDQSIEDYRKEIEAAEYMLLQAKIAQEAVAATSEEEAAKAQENIDQIIIKIAQLKGELATMIENRELLGTNRNTKSTGKTFDPDKLKSTRDIYHDINKELEHMAHLLNMLDKESKFLSGKALAENLAKQGKILEQELKATEQKRQIAADKMVELTAQQYNEDGTLSLAGYGAKFDKNGYLTNYDSIVKNAEAKVESARLSGNEEAYNEAKKQLDDLNNDIQEYEQYLADYYQLEEERLEKLNEIMENKLSQVKVKVEAEVDVQNARKQMNDFLHKYNKHTVDVNLRYSSSQSDIDAATSDTYLNDIDGSLSQIKRNKKQMSKWNKAYDKLSKGESVKWNGETWDPHEIEKFIEAGQEVEKMLEGLEDSAYASLDALHSAYTNAIQEALNADKQARQVFTDLNEQYDHAQKLASLLYGDDSIESKMVKASIDRDKLSNMQDAIKQAAADRDKYYDKYLEAAKNKDKEAAEYYLQAWQDTCKEVDALVEQTAELALENYKNLVSVKMEEVNMKLFGGKTMEQFEDSWTLVNKQADMYLDTINAQFGVQQLENKYMQAYNKMVGNTAAQKKINTAMNEELSILKQRDKLTQYDLDRANKKYELTMKQIALEEAQQNKSKMRLRRDSQGNYSYQYVADEDNIAEAQNNVAVARNDLYNLDKDRINELAQQSLDVWKEYYNKLDELNKDTTLSTEERLKKQAELEEIYIGENGILTNINKGYGIALGNVQSDVTEIYESQQGTVLESFEAMVKKGIDSVGQLVTGARPEIQNFIGMWDSKNDNGAAKIIGEAIDSLTQGENSPLEKYKKAIKDLAEKDTSLSKVIDNWGKAHTAVVDFQDAVKAEIDKTSLKSLLDLINGGNGQVGLNNVLGGPDGMAKKIKHAYNTYEKYFGGSKEKWENVDKLGMAFNTAKDKIDKNKKSLDDLNTSIDTFNSKVVKDKDFKITHTETYNIITNYKTNGTPSKETYSPAAPAGGGNGVGDDTPEKVEPKNSFYKLYDKTSGKLLTISNKKLQSDAIKELLGTITAPLTGRVDLTSKYIVKNPDDQEVHGNYDYASKKLTSLGNVDQIINQRDKEWANSAYNKNILKFDTGGYTGEWDSSGKLAMLHQKELVLNQTDTENILNAVAAVRDISSLLNNVENSILGRLIEVAGMQFNGNIESGVSQNIVINADFPAANDRVEIEAAFANLLSIAEQRAFKK